MSKTSASQANNTIVCSSCIGRRISSAYLLAGWLIQCLPVLCPGGSAAGLLDYAVQP